MPDPAVRSSDATGCLALLVRLSWLVAGNVVLFFLAMSIAQRGALSAFDFAYGATVVGLIGLRYLDIARFQGLTQDGAPATRRDWIRYVIVLVLVSGALWVLAHRVLSRVMLP